MQGKTIKQSVLERLFPGEAAREKVWLEFKTLPQTGIDAGLGGMCAKRGILDEELSPGDRA